MIPMVAPLTLSVGSIDGFHPPASGLHRPGRRAAQAPPARAAGVQARWAWALLEWEPSYLFHTQLGLAHVSNHVERSGWASHELGCGVLSRHSIQPHTFGRS